MPRHPIDPNSPTVQTSVRITEAHRAALEVYAERHNLPSRNAALCAILDKIARQQQRKMRP